MTANILDQVAAQSGHFVPSTPLHFLALHITRRLNDLENLNRYIVLSEHYPKELLLKAYQVAFASDSPGENFFAFFQKLTS
ncbi:MAG TPA: hypothetical protein VKY85_14430 [Candidatus Angelobacter sp.]|nr:hypothetical protein [Candidatus Angelobacter sp.]